MPRGDSRLAVQAMEVADVRYRVQSQEAMSNLRQALDHAEIEVEELSDNQKHLLSIVADVDPQAPVLLLGVDVSRRAFLGTRSEGFGSHTDPQHALDIFIWRTHPAGEPFWRSLNERVREHRLWNNGVAVELGSDHIRFPTPRSG